MLTAEVDPALGLAGEPAETGELTELDWICDIADRPLLFLDVDGVLLPVGLARPDGYEPVRAGPFSRCLSPALQDAMPALLAAFETHWLTSWNHDANLDIGPLFRLPHLPVLEVTAQYMKLRTLAGFAPAAGRAVAWVDDRLEPDAFGWADAREAPTLLVKPDDRFGLQTAEVDRLLAFGAQHALKGP